MKLRHYQSGCTPAVIQYLRHNPGKHPVVALPTGSGKTVCIADLIKYCIGKWDSNVLVLSHVKEILEQNHKTLSMYLDRTIGIYSAMLKKKDIRQVTVAGIQSVYRKPLIFNRFNLIIIDEAHLVSTNENTMYQRFLAGIGKHTCVGFTATPFRLGSGYIYGESEDAMFDDICYDWTSAEKFVQLIEEGFLCKLIAKRTKMEMDVKNIGIKAGDFNEKQMSKEFDRDSVTEAAVDEIIRAGFDRRRWLIFAIDIEHAEHIAEMLIRKGVPTAPIHSRMSESGFSRQQSLEGFANGKFRCVVNVNILTTGFDDPKIDLIAILRPTMSPVLHVQMLGRGCRMHIQKENCLVLDFAGNIMRLGPINDIQVTSRKKGESGGEAPSKECPKCSSIIAASARICPDCKHEFEFRHGLSPEAAEVTVISDTRPTWVPVFDVQYEKHSNYGKTSSVKVTYFTDSIKINEWVCVEHSGYAKHKADHWIKFRGGVPCNTVEELLDQCYQLKKPSKILIEKVKKYYILKDAVF